MKLLRFGEAGKEQPGILDSDGSIRSLAGIVDDIDGAAITEVGLEKIAALNISELPRIDGNVRIGPCLGSAGKIIAIGLNYSDHAAEAGMPLPKEPILFMKATTAISGPYDPVRLPPNARKADWEVELAFAIGKRASHVSRSEAASHVAGYMIMNDISERAWQAEREGQWVKGKSYDTFAPIGPWFVTSDEVAEPGNLKMTLDVNGERRQNGSTSTLIFGIEEIVSYVSQFMTLEPGDIITTGTPPGVGWGMKPPVFLKPGDVMRLEIEGLGHQEQTVVSTANGS
ncbi:MAG: fumarylacetoacetate hydrolase family protein [Nitratireductor sp.]|nr:fumarylacetoacetate hydrolase family protein [Nitratireductor sp.]